MSGDVSGRRAPHFKGTSRAEPCISCGGWGYDCVLRNGAEVKTKCAVCNGTRVMPLARHRAMLARSQRDAAMRRNAGRR